MKTKLAMTVALSVMAFCVSADAGQIWTDGNGDGLPDGGPQIIAPPSSNVTVGVWIDAQSFTWTNFLAFIEWPASNCISYVSASYVITGGSTFPIDNFSNPRAIGFGGSGFNQGGVDQIGNATFHINTPIECCVSPIISTDNPYYTFSQLGSGSAYMLFTTAGGTCFNFVDGPPGACCFPDFSCIPNMLQSACAAAGGTLWLEGQSCADCPDRSQTEACCFPDCSCVEAPVSGCPPGSVGLGAGTNCSPNPCSCPPQFEACCFPDGSCIDALIGQCPVGSVPQGIGTSCATTTCPPAPTGACCLADGSCLEGVTEEVCDASGGFSWYPGAPCDEACVPDAVESKSWGRIKGLFR